MDLAKMLFASLGVTPEQVTGFVTGLQAEYAAFKSALNNSMMNTHQRLTALEACVATISAQQSEILAILRGNQGAETPAQIEGTMNNGYDRQSCHRRG
jgi:hypothetical protein